MAPSKINTRFYSPQGLWLLFLICALPLHIWTIVLALRDFSWVSARTNSWDALGVISYGLVYTFIESVVIFILAILLGFLISKKWDEKRRIVLLGMLIVICSIWAMASHLYFLLEITPPAQVINFLAGVKHPLRTLYTSLLILVAPTFLIPAYLVLKSNTLYRFAQDGMDRLSLLMTLYLFFDLSAFIIVLIRNT